MKLSRQNLEVVYGVVRFVLCLAANYAEQSFMTAAGSCKQPISKNQVIYKIIKKEEYVNYCFYNNICTDTLLYSWGTSGAYLKGKTSKDKEDIEHVTIYRTTPVRRINVTKSDTDVVRQFLLSLKIYNLTAAGKNNRKILLDNQFTRSLFFDEREFKSHYRIKLDGEEIELYNLDLQRIYDYKHLIDEKINNDGQMEISFPDGVKLVCSQSFYQKFLFGYCLNYISKKHKLYNSYGMPIKYFHLIENINYD